MGIFTLKIVSSVSCAFVVHLLVYQTWSLPSPIPYQCTDCCDYLACMGLDNRDKPSPLDQYNGTDAIFQYLCSKINLVMLPTCYSTHNLQHCSALKRLIPMMPSQDKIAEIFVNMCKRQDEMKNITNCIATSNIGLDVIDRCTTPYLNGMKDPHSNICEVMKTMTNCMVVILKVANCGSLVSNYEKDMQVQMNQFCMNAPAKVVG